MDKSNNFLHVRCFYVNVAKNLCYFKINHLFFKSINSLFYCIKCCYLEILICLFI